ncbi:hypothetical protein JL721_1709 [Aureococcus anophagefferens]|nr:hypothetical protein JL721_1709 [Aureococcus anophagefferens]
MDDLDMGALDILGAGIVTTNEASKDPEEEARKAEAARHEAASDALSTAIKTEALSKGLATKFKLTHANKDDAGKRVNLLLVDQVTSTSVRLRWTRPKTRYRLDGVRIMMRESYGGQGFGSGAFTTATYCQAFFFEEPQEIDRLWSVFFGILTRGGEGGANALASGDDYVLAQKLTIAQSDPKPAAPPHDSGCALVGFDYKDRYSESKRARMVRQWEKLEVEIIGAPGDRAKIAVQATRSATRIYQGAVLLDACRVFMLGRDEVGDCCSELEKAAGEPRLNETGVLRVTVLEVINLPRFAGEAPPQLPDKAYPLAEKDAATILDDDGLDDDEPKVARRATVTKKASGKERPSKPRLVIKWGAKVVGESEPFDPIEEEKHALSPVGGVTPQAIAVDAARPTWRECDKTRHVLKVKASAKLGGIGVTDTIAGQVAKSMMRDSVLEIEVQDTAVRGVAARARRRKFELGSVGDAQKARKGAAGKRRTTMRSLVKRPGTPSKGAGDKSDDEQKAEDDAAAREAERERLVEERRTRAAEEKAQRARRQDALLARRQTAVFGLAPARARPTSPGSEQREAPGKLPPRPGTPGTDSEDEHLREQIVDTSKTETQHVDALASNAGLAIAGQQGLLAASRGEQRRGGGRMTMFGRKKPDEDDGGGAPIGRLRLTTRELMCAPPYRAWYRLEDETGLTHMCVALLVRFWDPVPRVPVFSFMARDVAKKEKEAEKERALLSSKTKQFQEEKRKQREIAKSIGALSRKLATECLNPKQRNTYFGKLLFMLGCSAGARVAKAGSSKSKKEVNDGETKKNLQGAIATMTIDRMDPTEAQQRIPVPELLKRKAEMVRQGVLEECVANLCNPRTQESAAALIAAVVTFPRVLIVNSSDIHRCSAALQGLVRGLGVLDFIEEACDVYCAEIQGAGASAKDDDNAISDASRAVAPMSVAEKACAAAFEGGRCAPARAPPAATAGALLAVVFGGARTMLVTEMSQRPCLFPVLARAVQENVPCAKKCLENLNFAIQFPPKLVHQYRRFRVLVPYLHDEYWRCPSLEMEMDANEEEMQNACRGARKRARAAERHRLATGAFPRRVRVPVRDTPLKVADASSDFSTKVTAAGSHAFFLEDAARPDLEFVAVAYGEMREGGALEDLSAEMDAAVGSPRPGTGAKRPRPRSARARLLEGGTPADDDEKQEEDVQKKFAAFFHRDSESDANESSDDGGSDSELSMEGAEQKKRAKTPKGPEVEGAGSAGLAAIGLGKAWRRKSMVKSQADADARAKAVGDVAANPLQLEFVEKEEEPRRGSVKGALSALAGGSKWKNMIKPKKADLPVPEPGDGDAPLNPQVGRRRSFGMAASARSLGAMKKLRAKIKGDGGDDDEPPPSSEEDG